MKSDDRKIPHPYDAKRFAVVLLAEKLLTLQCFEKYANLNHELFYKTGHHANQHLDLYIHATANDSKEDEQL